MRFLTILLMMIASPVMAQDEWVIERNDEFLGGITVDNAEIMPQCINGVCVIQESVAINGAIFSNPIQQEAPVEVYSPPTYVMTQPVMVRSAWRPFQGLANRPCIHCRAKARGGYGVLAMRSRPLFSGCR